MAVTDPAAPFTPVARPRGRIRRRSGADLLGTAVSAVVVLLVGVPLAFLIFASLRNTEGKLPFEATNFTLQNYVDVFSSHQTYKIFAVTLGYAAADRGGARDRRRLRVPARAHRRALPLAVMAMLLAPMALPPFVAAVAWVLLANPEPAC